MLIDKGISRGDVITIKLNSGEELIASFVEETDTYIKVSKPRVLASANNGIGIAPYLFTVDADRDIKIYKPVVVMEPTQADYAKQYTETTTSIQLV